MDIGTILLIALGLFLLASCNPTRNLTSSERETTIESSTDIATEYSDTLLTLRLTGDSSIDSSGLISVRVIDSVVIRDSLVINDSIVYKEVVKYNYKDVDLNDLVISADTAYTVNSWGNAKAWYDNGRIHVAMTVNDSLFEAKVDSAVRIKTITNTNNTTTTIKEVYTERDSWFKRTFKNIRNAVLLLIALLFVLMVVVFGLKRFR